MHRRGDRVRSPTRNRRGLGLLASGRVRRGHERFAAARRMETSTTGRRPTGRRRCDRRSRTFVRFLAPAGIHQMLADAEFVRAAEAGSAEPPLAPRRHPGCRDRQPHARSTRRSRSGLSERRLCSRSRTPRPPPSGSPALASSRSHPRRPVTGRRRGSRRERRWPLRGAGTRPHATRRHRAHRTGDGARLTTATSTEPSVELANARRSSHLYRGTRWLNADMNLRWGNISLDLGDRRAAQEHADTARAALHGYPDPGTLPSRLAELDNGSAASPSSTSPRPRSGSFPSSRPTSRSRRSPNASMCHRDREDTRFLRLRQAWRRDEIGRGHENGGARPPIAHRWARA